jgi:four helix bundle protein
MGSVHKSDHEDQRSEGARSFEDLWIWQTARELVRLIYQDFREGTPGAQDFGFRTHIQKTGVSAMNNIAEGFERRTESDFARFLDISKGSCGEVRSMYYVAEDLGYVATSIAEARRQRARQLASGIASLADRLRRCDS